MAKSVLNERPHHFLIKKVKCTLVQALRICTGCMTHKGSKRIAVPFHDHGTRRGWGVSVTPRPLCTPGKDPVPIVQEAGWAPGPVWTGAENLVPTGIRSPDRPAHSQSLYQLRYLVHVFWLQPVKKCCERVLHLLLVKCKKIKYTKGTFCVLYSLYCHSDSEYMAGTC